MPPTPGPYSTMTRARPKLIGSSSCLIRKRELGTIEPSMRGWRKKLRTNSSTSPLPLRCGMGLLIVHFLNPRSAQPITSIAIFARGHHLAEPTPSFQPPARLAA